MRKGSRKDEERTDKKIMYGRNFMCRGSGWKHTVRAGIWEQMCPGTAYGKCALCGIVRTWIRSLIRNLLALGSILAFPGSMFGALLCGVVYWKSKNLLLTLLGEVFGTAILGGLCAYPLAVLVMGVSAGEVAFYAYVLPFFVSTAGGAILAGILIEMLKKAGVLRMAAKK